jgi:hypothetical protein
MGTREQVGLRPGDIATMVHVEIRGNKGTISVPLAPDISWTHAEHSLGSAAKVVYVATVLRVTETEEHVTYGTAIASTTEHLSPGSRIGLSRRFNGFTGGENNPTDEQLRKAGVSITVTPNTESGGPSHLLHVDNPYPTLREHLNRNTQQ